MGRNKKDEIETCGIGVTTIPIVVIAPVETRVEDQCLQSQ